MNEPDLLQNARRVTPFDLSAAYFWISPDELLVLRPVVLPPDRPEESLEEACERVAKTTHNAYRVVLSTGEETPFEEFNRRHSAAIQACVVTVRCGNEVEATHHPPPAAVSPDGRWLLWQGRQKWHAARLDGSASTEWPISEDRPHHVIWLPGSRRWAELDSHYTGDGFTIPNIILRRPDNADYQRRVTITNLKEGLIAGITARNSLILHQAEFPGSNRNEEEVIAFWGRMRRATTVHFSEVDLRLLQAQPRRFTILLPIPGHVLQPNFSLSNNRLAAIIQVSPEYQRTTGQYCLWTCDLDGGTGEVIGWTNMQKMPSRDNPEKTIYASPMDPKWSPDGKHISFFYGDAVFAVPVGFGTEG